ncbi:MAG: cupin domain-containing protein [Streptosporangiales bacterium]|nr:cupin domain-containing protein [Streptosporangiales bacterium]
MKKSNLKGLKLTDVRPGVTRRSFSGEGATLSWGTLTPGHEPRPHTHPHEQIVYIMSGHGTFTVGDETVDVTEGDMLVVPSNELHYAVAGGDEPMVDLSIFNPRREDYYRADEVG